MVILNENGTNMPNSELEQRLMQMTVGDIGSTVRAERRRLGLTQTDLADLAGVSDRFVREVEKGKESAELGKVAAVLDVLGFELQPVSVNPLRQVPGK